MNATYEFEFSCDSPLLMHFDNIEDIAKVDEWRKNPENKSVSVKGDDRSPAWTWIAYLYRGGGKLVMPSDNVMVSLRNAGAQIEIPGGKRGKTFKDATQYGIIPVEESFEFFNHGEPVPTDEIDSLWEDNDFPKHARLAEKLGFKLFVKRAKIGQSKHIRVRPIFSDWSVKGKVLVTEPAITDGILADLFRIAGGRSGLGDWRPSSKTPGSYGRFTVESAKVA